MDSLFKTISSGGNGHPSEDVLLLHVDGELATKAVTTVRAHLDACWSCRVRTEKIEEAISTFIDYRNQVLRPLSTPPPGDWRGFDGRLRGLVSEVGRPSVFANLRGALGRVFSIPSVSLNLGFLMRPIAVTLVLVLLVAVFLRFNRTSIVSASEMLQRSVAAQQNEISRTPQAVVYQKLHVRRKTASSPTSQAFTWEVWNDTVNSRTRRSMEDAAGRRFLNDEVKASTDNAGKANNPPIQNESTLTQLSSVLRANHMNGGVPLSAASYQAWSRSVASKHEEVTKTTSNGRETLTLRTAVTGQVAPGAIAEASLVVRANDWHAIEERLRVRTDQGDEEFELVEAAYSVVSLNTLSPEIFKDQPVVASSPADSPSPEKKEETANALSPLSLTPLPPAATANLELEALDLLHKVGADISEQLNVTRTADGRLLVEGLVESDKRKAEILSALSPVANNPAIRIKIQTIEEATRAIARQKQTPGTVDRIEIEKGALPVDEDLRQYFANRGGDTDAAIRSYASRVVARSQAALFQASALQRLANRFTPAQLAALTQSDRAKWLGILRGYAASVRRESASLRGELNPVFGGMSGGGDGETISSDADLIASAKRLYDLASANDRVVRSAFTLSSGGSVSAIKTAQFRRSLASAESLAAAIERAR